jgi:dCTP deaminase
MSLEKKVGCCLTSQHIRGRIEEGTIISALDEPRIQPSSFEPTVGDEIFILDTETEGMFRPRQEETIYRTLLQLPRRQRRKVDINSGFELKRGFTYLARLNERLKLNNGEYVKSSPKSSGGRVFLNTRLLADFNPCFDEVISRYCPDSEIGLWALLQPLAFNLIISPGLTLNQLRFFTGSCSQLNAEDINSEFNASPLLFTKTSSGLIPAKPIVTDGLQLHLDLAGINTEGIVGLRARRNPDPIDLAKKSEYDAEDFFEPVISRNGSISVRPGEYYLLSSEEVLKIPAHLNSELQAHSHIGITGPLHFAGFIDNGFEGDLVFEVRADEISNMVLRHGMPISRLNIFRTDVPDKLYGVKIGSNYQNQVGTRPAKYFRQFDFKFAAKNYEKLDKLVLVQDKRVLLRHRKTESGFEPIEPEAADALMADINQGFFHSRYDCETDEDVLQLIPYVAIFDRHCSIFSYVRAKEIKDYGDSRLFGKHSVGIGGHVIKSDAPDYILNCLRRELAEEVKLDGLVSMPVLVGTIISYDKPVDRVHFGLVYGIVTDGDVQPAESSIISGRMIKRSDITIFPGNVGYETWSCEVIKDSVLIWGKTLIEFLKQYPEPSSQVPPSSHHS